MKHLPRPSSPLATRARTWLWRATIRPASLLVTSGKHWSQVCKQAVFWDSPPEKDAHHGMQSLDPGNSYYTTKREPGSLSPEGSMLRKVKSLCLYLFFLLKWRYTLYIRDAAKKKYGNFPIFGLGNPVFFGKCPKENSPNCYRECAVGWIGNSSWKPA